MRWRNRARRAQDMVRQGLYFNEDTKEYDYASLSKTNGGAEVAKFREDAEKLAGFAEPAAGGWATSSLRAGDAHSAVLPPPQALAVGVNVWR